jgi:hypothetical protein
MKAEGDLPSRVLLCTACIPSESFSSQVWAFTPAQMEIDVTGWINAVRLTGGVGGTCGSRTNASAESER